MTFRSLIIQILLVYMMMFVTACVSDTSYLYDDVTYGTKDSLPVSVANLKEMAGYCKRIYGDGRQLSDNEYAYDVIENNGSSIVIIRGTDNARNVLTDLDDVKDAHQLVNIYFKKMSLQEQLCVKTYHKWVSLDLWEKLTLEDINDPNSLLVSELRDFFGMPLSNVSSFTAQNKSLKCFGEKDKGLLGAYVLAVTSSKEDRKLKTSFLDQENSFQTLLKDLNDLNNIWGRITKKFQGLVLSLIHG